MPASKRKASRGRAAGRPTAGGRGLAPELPPDIWRIIYEELGQTDVLRSPDIAARDIATAACLCTSGLPCCPAQLSCPGQVRPAWVIWRQVCSPVSGLPCPAQHCDACVVLRCTPHCCTFCHGIFITCRAWSHMGLQLTPTRDCSGLERDSNRMPLCAA